MFAPLAMILVGLNNWWVGHVGLDFSMTLTGLATFGFVATAVRFLPKKRSQQSKIKIYTGGKWRSADV